ncbi:hypothetical protein ACFT38_14605 [Streptomyces sp. NPDC056975]|uniref:hypothetical protein n=1 Tax=Streptomyces sp. NPDC056975 TaxID=3345985 RepID=UPI00363D0880
MELDQAWLTACQATWKRWLSGDRIPRSDAGAVLEFMLGVDAETLLRPAVECGVVLPQIAPSAARDAARLLNSMFDTSYLDPLGRASGMEGVWHLDGQRFFDGTSVAVQLYEADEQDGRVFIGAHHHAHVRAFTRATRHALQERLADGGAAPQRVFCIPATDAGASQRYERILLWPAVAMMERDGQKISVCAEPEYKRIDGFVLVPGRRVISANWLGSEGIWHVDTTDSLADVSAYAQVVEHVRSQSVTKGDSSEGRLRSLAHHLDLDWGWLVRRCRELGAYGIAGMLRPRSRLISVEELERVLRFAGEFDD